LLKFSGLAMFWTHLTGPHGQQWMEMDSRSFGHRPGQINSRFGRFLCPNSLFPHLSVILLCSRRCQHLELAAAGGEMVLWGDGEESSDYQSSDSSDDVSSLPLKFRVRVDSGDLCLTETKMQCLGNAYHL
jgi:hypothetical protein